jgi:protein TonB
LPRRPASPRTQSPAIPEDPSAAAKAPVARVKAAARRKVVLPAPANEPAEVTTPPRAPAKRRAARSAAAVTVIPSASLPKGAAPKPARRPPASRPKLAAAPAMSADVAALATPVWLPIFDRAGDERANRLFRYTLAISIAIHVIVLAIKFQPFDLQKMLDRGPPLEVALVNAKSLTKPTKADILAQAHLDGGGNTDANRRAKTPLPVLPKDSHSADLTVATQRVETLEQQTRELMTRLKSAPTAPTVAKPTEAADPKDVPTSAELMQRTLEAMQLEAQIAKDMEAYQKRPKRRFVGARAEEYRFARYVEDWRLKIERVGNLNYPEAARELKLYGSLLLTVSIRADGSVESVRVNRSSGQRVLDAAAVHIVEMSAPFAPFPPDIRRDTDILHITRTWSFTKGDQLRSD